MFIRSYRALGDKSLEIFGQHITSFIQIYHRCYIQGKRKTEMDHISWIFSYYYSGSTPSEKSNQIVDHLQCRLKISLISLPLHEQVFFLLFSLPLHAVISVFRFLTLDDFLCWDQCHDHMILGLHQCYWVQCKDTELSGVDWSVCALTLTTVNHWLWLPHIVSLQQWA